MSGWGSNPVWPKVVTITYPTTPNFTPIKYDGMVTVDLDKNGNITEAGKQAIVADMQKVYSNKVPTHDPYTNPNSHIYYECKCGAILDPNIKSFAALNNYASEKGWKVRWRQDGAGYEPFCVECGKDVE